MDRENFFGLIVEQFRYFENQCSFLVFFFFYYCINRGTRKIRMDRENFFEKIV